MPILNMLELVIATNRSKKQVYGKNREISGCRAGIRQDQGHMMTSTEISIVSQVLLESDKGAQRLLQSH